MEIIFKVIKQRQNSKKRTKFKVEQRINNWCDVCRGGNATCKVPMMYLQVKMQRLIDVFRGESAKSNVELMYLELEIQ